MNPGVIQQILEWLERVAPGLLGAFGLGYKLGARKTEALEDQVIEQQLQLELERDKTSVEENNRGKSDVDVIRDAIKRAK